jgi:hypothetical protein
MALDCGYAPKCVIEFLAEAGDILQFFREIDAISVVREPQRTGVPESDIRVLTRDNRASGAATGAEIGAAIGGLAGLLTGLGLVAIPGIGPVVAGGWLAATAAGARSGGVRSGFRNAAMLKDSCWSPVRLSPFQRSSALP